MLHIHVSSLKSPGIIGKSASSAAPKWIYSQDTFKTSLDNRKGKRGTARIDKYRILDLSPSPDFLDFFLTALSHNLIVMVDPIGIKLNLC